MPIDALPISVAVAGIEGSAVAAGADGGGVVSAFFVGTSGAAGTEGAVVCDGLSAGVPVGPAVVVGVGVGVGVTAIAPVPPSVSGIASATASSATRRELVLITDAPEK
ncbi:hypothetical protein [Arthrobacter ulcerisalmonis]|uniref:hypothetical protein n=1 Tax=Arthrobacter ulcerisalmonis TaxID=2483813 RepID=UPI000F52795E|nr:hypothetical protein [Arthrobacter ulcerisalmonis]